MHEEQLGHVPVPVLLLLLPDGGTDHGRFLGDDRPLLGGRLARPDLPDEVAQPEGHGGTGVGGGEARVVATASGAGDRYHAPKFAMICCDDK